MIENNLQTNLDTNFLKIIAIVAMVLDHIGKAFFPDVIIFQLIGRLAFPIFAYCIVVGVMYTSNFKKYLIRLGSFALISQIPWVLAFNPTVESMIENWMNLNIFFTLFFAALFVYGMKDKQWISLVISVLAFSLLPLDYGFDTVFLLASLYLLRNYKVASCVLTTLVLGLPLLVGGDTPFMGFMINLQGFAVLAVPFIYLKTNLNLRINKYFFYCFYPVHLLIIAFIRLVINA